MSPEATAGSVEMAFGLWGGVGPRNHVLDGGLDPPQGNRHARACQRSVYTRTRCGVLSNYFDVLFCFVSARASVCHGC